MYLLLGLSVQHAVRPIARVKHGAVASYCIRTRRDKDLGRIEIVQCDTS